MLIRRLSPDRAGSRYIYCRCRVSFLLATATVSCQTLDVRYLRDSPGDGTPRYRRGRKKYEFFSAHFPLGENPFEKGRLGRMSPINPRAEDDDVDDASDALCAPFKGHRSSDILNFIYRKKKIHFLNCTRGSTGF